MADILVDDLHLSYGPVDVLKGVSLEVERGQILALLGASGSGKTTLLRAVAGLETPRAGRIVQGSTALFDGGKRIDLAPEARNLGFVFQSYALWPHRTVNDNVAYPLRLRKMGRAEIEERVKKALGSIGLGHLGDRFPHQLSGGQQQRVALARALVYEPRVILLDEPLSNLDAKLREEARIWLRRLITNLGLSALCVTHDQVEAMAMADRILLLNHGTIAQNGTPHEIYTKPNSLYVAEFMGAHNRFEGTVKAIEGERVTLDVGGRTLHGRARGPLAVGAKVVAIIRLERLTARREPGPDRVPMTLAESLFLGDRWELVFDWDVAASGETKQLVRAFALDGLDPGTWQVELPEQDLMVFPAE
jgi:iron(III) transport system ATP-binding protein